MSDTVLAKLFEHNNWANRVLIRACSALADEQLDATPRSPRDRSLRRVLIHLVESQQSYLFLLAGPPPGGRPPLSSFDELAAAATSSGEGLLAVARDEGAVLRRPRIRTEDGYSLAPWIILVQAINHATEHRRQICGMLRDLRVDPPRLDGWGFGEAVEAVVRAEP